ncbi:hypothetical protein CHLNCDRAFT_140017 [Chlorella variabilis]|uniref:Uncharacterized protein n=1 Tax=Chlorella variabilis TaxID=554065 RepID=E1ZRE2_CHLVA|nr:hypothetical protein CHLNCDRAFT_140017 [Chlorella variabilis]EFN51553.1 hypothetical protein CHLNCDRAFT_140017 [Chlorella variabilis]|eukprot:XP_005843655.1 hypothetical protein CHLNCDRAFT_140017 [Chlorella variabilis]
MLARLLHELPSLPEQAGENVRLAAAQLAAFVPCSILEAEQPAGGAAAAEEAAGGRGGGGSGTGNGNGTASSDAELVVVDAASGGGSCASLEALPAGGAAEDAVLLVSCSAASLRRAAVAYLDGVFDRSVDRMFQALRSGEAGVRGTPGGCSGAATPPPAAAAPAGAPAGGGALDGAGLAAAVGAAAVAAAAAAGTGGGGAGPGAVAAVEEEMPEAALGGGSGEEEEEEEGAHEGAASLMSEDEAVLLEGPGEAEAAAAAAAAAGGGELAVKGSPEYQAAVAHISFTVQMMEVIPSELQFVAMEARKALVCFKYLPLPGHLVGPVLTTLEQASTAELWPERGSALLFAQYFWFRHTFILGPEGTARVQAMVCAMLADAKLEVREMAATTLSEAEADAEAEGEGEEKPLLLPGINTLAANTALGSEQVFHGGVRLAFDAAGAAVVTGVHTEAAQRVLRMWPVLQADEVKAGRWSSAPLEEHERYFLARMLQQLGPMLLGQGLREVYPADLVIPRRFRPTDDGGTPLDGPMTASAFRRAVGVDGEVPRAARRGTA